VLQPPAVKTGMTSSWKEIGRGFSAAFTTTGTSAESPRQSIFSEVDPSFLGTSEVPVRLATDLSTRIILDCRVMSWLEASLNLAITMIR
jgi:hypothetical protein